MMPLLFSYGSLQLEDVQMSTFGRRLAGAHDTLVGFKRETVIIDGAEEANVKANGASRVAGVVFDITAEELARADAFEAEYGYERIEGTLASGRRAWVYVLGC